MKMKKKINNNVALCYDSKGKEVIVTGRGIGFVNPNTNIDLAKIERTFYNLNREYIHMLDDLSPQAFKVADIVIHYAADKLLCELNDNLLFSLADHIDFALERFHRNLNQKLPIFHDVEHLFETEMEIGRFALRQIKKEYDVELPEEEAARIALNILNSEYNPMRKSTKINNQIIDDITEIIERIFHIQINRHNFNYSRFATHMYYLFKRENENKVINSRNRELYQTMVTAYPLTNRCVNLICDYFENTRNWNLSEEERLYLILHINRLCDKEEK